MWLKWLSCTRYILDCTIISCRSYCRIVKTWSGGTLPGVKLDDRLMSEGKVDKWVWCELFIMAGQLQTPVWLSPKRKPAMGDNWFHPLQAAGIQIHRAYPITLCGHWLSLSSCFFWLFALWSMVKDVFYSVNWSYAEGWWLPLRKTGIAQVNKFQWKNGLP